MVFGGLLRERILDIRENKHPLWLNTEVLSDNRGNTLAFHSTDQGSILSIPKVS